MIQLNARNYAWNKRKHDTAQHSCVRYLGKALDKRDWRWHLTSAFSQRLRKYTFTAVHTKTHKRRFQIYPLWRAFLNLCVYGERFQRLRVDGRPKRIKKFAFTSVCVYNRLRVDGGGMPPNPLATPACLGWPFGLATALVTGVNRVTGVTRVTWVTLPL